MSTIVKLNGPFLMPRRYMVTLTKKTQSGEMEMTQVIGFRDSVASAEELIMFNRGMYGDDLAHVIETGQAPPRSAFRIFEADWSEV